MNEKLLIKPRHPPSIYYYSWCHCSYPIRFNKWGGS